MVNICTLNFGLDMINKKAQLLFCSGFLSFMQAFSYIYLECKNALIIFQYHYIVSGNHNNNNKG